MLDPIAEPLRDRMEIIELQGYTEEEKVHIAFQYLIPRQIEENGITPEQIEFPEEAVSYIIRHYTREAGVRNLERTIGTICRKQARRLAEGKTEKLVVANKVVQEFLGGIKVRSEGEIAERTKRAGVVVGLAWTPSGGDVLFVEANQMKGKGGLTITGQIQDVMRESMQAALSWVRSNAKELGIDEEFFANHDIHIHVPAGAIPKDGPSAGVTIVTALVSLLTGKQVRPLTAMTGEITLSGNVLPVGGIKEKVLAAKRAGVHDVILPADNKTNVEEDLTPEQLHGLTTHYVKTIDEVLEIALPSFAAAGTSGCGGAGEGAEYVGRLSVVSYPGSLASFRVSSLNAELAVFSPTTHQPQMRIRYRLESPIPIGRTVTRADESRRTADPLSPQHTSEQKVVPARDPGHRRLLRSLIRWT